MEIKNTEYEKALKQVIDTRLQRKKIYGDGWKQHEDWEILAFIKNKVGRLQHLLFNSDIESDEKIEDTYKAGIIEPLKIKTQAISSASEMTNTILRIDDILYANS